MYTLTSIFPTIKTLTKASTLALSIFTFLLAVETQAKEGFDKSSYLDLSKPYVYNGNTPRSTTRKDNQATALLKETAGTIRNTIGSTNSDNADGLDNRITTNIKNQLKNKVINNTETLVNDKANEFVNQFGSGRTEVKIGGLASDEIDYGIKTIQPLSKLDEKSKDLTFLQGQISSGENHGERRGTINLGVGHRLLVEDDMAIAGVNIFGDNELDSGHKRLSLGLEYQRSNFSSHINAYYPISDEKIIGEYVEEALAGHDVKLTGQVPYLPWAKAKGTYYHWDATKGTNINGSILGMEIKLTPSINFEFGQEDSNTTSSKSYGKLSVELPISDNEQFIDFAVDDKPFKASGVMDLTDLEFVERANKIRIEKTLASNAGTASLGEYNAKTVGASCTLEDSDGSIKLGITDDSGGIKLKGIEMKAGLVTLSCTGGSYIDEATGKTTNAANMRAAFIHSGKGDFTVSASPLSEIAYRLAETGAGLAADIAAKNKMVATKFGISSVNFVKTIPTELNDKRANNDNAGKFGLILAAVSQMMESDSSISINTLITYLTQDDEILAYKLITAMNECNTGSAGDVDGVACSGTGNLGAAFSATGEGSIKGNFAIILISLYDGTNTVPSIENYNNAGVSGVTIANLAEVNAVVAKATPANSNTAAKIQTLANSAAGQATTITSILTASPTTVVADGEALSTITLQAKDVHGNNLVTGSLDVTMTASNSARLSAITDNADGTYTAEITSTTAGDAIITASIAGAEVSNTATVSFTAGEVSLALTGSTLVADPTTVVADGEALSTITLQAKDVHGNNIATSGLDVTMTATNSARLSAITDNADGTYTAEITSTTAGDAIVTASIAGAEVSNTATVSFIAGELSLTLTGSTLVADPITIVADGEALSTITLQVKDVHGNNLATSDLAVTMVITTGDATLTPVKDNLDGTYTATITSATAGDAVITAKIAGEVVTNTATVSFIPGEASLTTSTVTADSTTVIADGKALSTIILQAIDSDGNNLITGGLDITMVITTGDATLGDVKDVGDGTYTAELSSTTAGEVVITAKIAGAVVTNTATVSFIPGEVSLTTSTLIADPITIVADGEALSTITLQARDVYGNNLVIGGLEVTMTASNSATLSTPVTDNLDGTYTATITSTTARDAVITARIAGAVVTNTATVSFIPGEASLTTSTLIADPTTVRANNYATSTITLQTKDAQGNNLVTGGLAVTWETTGSATLNNMADAGDGTYTAEIINTKAEDVTITVSINTVAVDNTATVRFKPGLMSIIKTTLSASPTNVVADGKEKSTITIQTKDTYGNNLLESSVDLGMETTGSAKISAVTNNLDGTYTATITNTVAESVTLTATHRAKYFIETVEVNFIPGEASLTTSTVTADPTTVISDGKALSTITLQVKDVHGNNLVTGSLDVTMTATNSATLGDITDNKDGTYTTEITSTTAGDAVITARIAGAVVTNTATISFIASIGDVSVATSTLVADPTTIVADGKTQSSITLQVKDADGENLTTTGLAVTMTASNSATLSTPVTDNLDGTYTATITSTTTAGDAVITARIAGAVVTNTATVSFIPGEASLTTSTLIADPTTVRANNYATSTITLQTKDAQGNNLVTGGLAVTWETTGSATLNNMADAGDGTYTAEIINTKAEDVTITVSINTVAVDNTATVRFKPGLMSIIKTTLSASPTNVVADGKEKSTITIQTKDTYGNNLLESSVDLGMETTGSAKISAVTNNLDGTYTATITNTVAESVTLTATHRAKYFIETVEVNFIPGEASLTTSTVTADPTTVISDGKALSTITLQVKDVHGNNLVTGNLDVTMTATNSATLGDITDNKDGTYTAEITSNTTGDAVITAKIAGAVVTNTATISFIASIGDVSVATSTLIADPTTIVADGETQSSITLQVKDADGENLTTTGLAVTMTASNSAKLSTPVTDNLDGTYTATITSTTTAGDAVITARIAGAVVTNTATVSFIPGEVSLTTSTVTADTTSLIADGEALSTITLQTKDAQGNNLVTGGLAVTWETTGSATLNNIADAGDGTYTAEIINTKAEYVTITVSINTVAVDNTATVRFKPGLMSLIKTTLSASPTNVVADGKEKSTITIQTKDIYGNNLIEGYLYLGMETTGSAKISAVTNNLDGTYTATITNTVAESVTLTATYRAQYFIETVEVNFIPGEASLTTSTVTADPITIITDGKALSTITLQVKDVHGNNLVTGSLDVTMTATNSATLGDITDNKDGTYTADITSNTTGDAVITAKIAGAVVTNTATISFIASIGDVSVATSTLIADPTTIVADGETQSSITLQVKDADGENLTTTGLAVTMTATNSATLSTPVTDNLDGTYTATITSTTAGDAVITAKIAGVEVSNTATVSFIPGEISLTTSTVTADPTTIVADGETQSSITLQVKDADGENLTTTGLAVTMTATNSATLSAVTDNEDGTYTAEITSSTAGDAIITAKIAGAVVTNTATVSFIPGEASLTTSTVTADPTTVVADGKALSTITLQAKDIYGNDLATGGLDVTMTATNSATLSAVTDNLDGTYTATITSTTAGDAVITAKIAGVEVSNTATVSFIPGEASLVTSTVTADPTTIVANDIAKSTITLQTIDAKGNDLATGGLDVTMTATNSATLSAVTDNEDGTYTATITSATAGDAVITASIAGAVVANTATVSFIPEASLVTSTVTADLTTVVADDIAKSTITLQAKNAKGNNLATGGLDVTMTATNSATLSTPVKDNLDGTYTATITSTTTGNALVTARIAGAVVVNTATVSFIASIGDVSVATSTLVADPTTIVADGKTQSSITLQAKDADGENLTTTGLAVTMTASNSATLSTPVTDNLDGTYTATITSTTAGDAVITARIAGAVVTNTATVSFIPGEISLTTSTVTAGPITVIADDKALSTITLQAKDIYGNDLATGGLDVTMTATNSATLSAVTDNADGTYTAEITSTTAGDAIITAKIAGAVVTNTATVSFIPGEASLTTSTVTADLTTIVANDIAKSTITLQTIDAKGNNLVTGSLDVTMTATNSATLSAVTDNADGTYTAEITSTTAGDAIITASIAGAVVVNTATISFIATIGDVSVATSTLVADPTTIVADGKALSTITLQVKDVHGNNLATSDLAVTMVITTGDATLSNVTDNLDGTYTATVTSTTAGDAIITTKIAGAVVVNTATVSFTAGNADATTSTMTANLTTVVADGEALSTITLQVKDVYGNNLITGGLDIVMMARVPGGNSATLSAVTDNEDGTYTATITSTTAGDAVITASIAGAEVSNTATVSFIAGEASLATSTLSADPTTVIADGKAFSTITLQAKDIYGNDLATGGLYVTMTATNSIRAKDNLDGTYTAIITAKIAGDTIITAKIAGVAVTNTATVSFIPGEVSLTTSTVTADPTSLIANGEALSIVTLQTKDAYGNNLVTGGLNVVMIVVSSNVNTPDSAFTVIDGNDGTYIIKMISYDVEIITVFAKINGEEITHNPTIVNFIPGEVSLRASIVTADPTTVVADGKTKSTITLQTIDAYDHNLVDGNLAVTWQTTGSAVLSNLVDIGDGTYTVDITNDTAEDVTIIAKIAGEVVTNTATVSFIPGKTSTTTSALVADPTTVVADGKTKSTITLQTKDAQGNNLVTGGLDVTMTATNSATLSDITDNKDGTYTADITSNTTGDAVITAKIAGAVVTNTATISFIATIGDVSVAASTLVADPTTIVADGKTQSSITLQVKDADGENLTTTGLAVTMTASNSATLSTPVTDNLDGTYTATITSTTAGDAVITAKIAGVAVTNTATVSFIAGELSVASTGSTLVADPTIMPINVKEKSTITLQVKDAHGNNLATSNLDVTMTASNSAKLSTPVTDNLDGTYTATITSTTLGDAVVTASIAGVVVINTATVIFEESKASLGTSTLRVSSTTVLADGKEKSTITLQIKDAKGNNLIIGGLDITMTATNSATLGDITDNKDGTYTATITSTTAGDVIITARIDRDDIKNKATIIFYTPGDVNLWRSTLSAFPTTVAADGVAESTITLQAKDINGMNLADNVDKDIIMSTTGDAILSQVIGHNDGTYTAKITNNTIETVRVSVFVTSSADIEENLFFSTARVNFIEYKAGEASVETSTLTADSTTAIVVADDNELFTITLQAIDAQGNNLITGDLDVTMEIIDGDATLSDVINNTDGTYTAKITSTRAGDVTIAAKIAGVIVTNKATVSFAPGKVSVTTSTLKAEPTTVAADGKTMSTITMQAKDVNGNNLVIGYLTVRWETTGSAILKNMTDMHDGTYTVEVTNIKAEDVIITAIIAGTEVVTNTAIVSFTVGDVSAEDSTISADTTTLLSNGIAKSTITLQAKDTNGVNLVTGDLVVTIMATVGSGAIVSEVIDNKNGTYTATIINNTAETVDIYASIDGIPLVDVVKIYFYETITDASVAKSILTASPTTVVADGKTISTITMQAKDAQNNNLITGGLDVAMGIEDGSNTAILSAVKDNHDGTYIATITNTTAEDVLVSASISKIFVYDGAIVSFTPGIASVKTSTITTSKMLVDINHEATITLQAKDANGANLTTGGLVVAIRANNGHVIIGDVNDVGDGTYTATITSASAENIIISASIAGTDIDSTAQMIFKRSATVTVDSSTSILRIGIRSMPADGVSTLPVYIHLKDKDWNKIYDYNIIKVNGNLVDNDAFNIRTSSGTLSEWTNTNNLPGIYAATLTSSTTAGTVDIVGTIYGKRMKFNTTASFTAGPFSLDTSVVTVHPTSISTEESSRATVTFHPKDEYGNNIIDTSLVPIFSSDVGAYIGNVIKRHEDGTYTQDIGPLNNKEESGKVFVYLARRSELLKRVKNDATLSIYTYNAISLTNSTLTASPTIIAANGRALSTITLQVKDIHGNNLVGGGYDVMMSTAGYNATIIDPVYIDGLHTSRIATDHGDGTYSITIASSKAETVVITAKIVGFGNEIIADTAEVTFVSSIVSVQNSALSASSTTVLADGKTKTTITLQSKDENGVNLITGDLAVTMTVQPSIDGATTDAIISDVIDNKDGTYTAQLSSTTVGDVIVTASINGVDLLNGIKIIFIFASESFAFRGRIYKTIMSPHTGRIWLDRNLGASRVCRSSKDSACFGDLYQWGRAKDGHESRTSSHVNSLSTSMTPGHGNFISNSTMPSDWMDDSIDLSGARRSAAWADGGENDICPGGYSVPTGVELESDTVKAGEPDKITNTNTAFSSILKLPSAGVRKETGEILMEEANKEKTAYYWSRQIANLDVNKWIYAYDFSFGNEGANIYYRVKSTGMSVRCIKVEE